MKSLFPYVGGKHRTAAKLIALFPDHRCYVEVFAGALNVLFAKPRIKVEVVNDVSSDLVNIFRVVRWHPEALLDQLSFITHSRQEFNDYHNQPGLTDVQRAARYWFKLKTTFGGTGPAGHRNFMFGTTGRAGLRHTALETILQAHERLDNVQIENDDFEKIIRRYDRQHTFFFCDPPYWQGADYGTPFEWSDHERLAKTLQSIKGKFLLTINDRPDIRRLYQGYPRLKVNVTYSVARQKNPGARQRTELVIANYPLPRRW